MADDGSKATGLSRSALIDLKKAMMSNNRPKKIGKVKMGKRKKLGTQAPPTLGSDA